MRDRDATVARPGLARDSATSAFGLAVTLVALLLGTPYAVANSCPPLYAVEYAAPTWLITWKSGPPGPLSQLWYVDPWNDSLQRIGPHIGSNASSAERVTFEDRDRDLNLSRFDVFEVWDENSTLATFFIRLGPNETSTYIGAAFTLRDGYDSQCGGSWPVWGLDMLLLGAAFLASVTALIVLLVRRWSNK